MPMRLQEVHPSLVHFPITLLPAAIAADALGRATGNDTLLEVGKRGIALAAGAAAVAATAGLMAQQEVKAEGEGLDALITHRNLNLAAVAVATAMAVSRSSKRKPSLGYLALGLASIGLVTFTAYLGGHMVYELGVGVKPAGGVRDHDVPQLTASEMPHAARTAGQDLVDGAKTTVKELGEGKLAPALGSAGR